jgi:hypothetical protein
MSNLPYSGRLTARHCPVHLQRQISPLIPTVFRIVQTEMFALCSCLYDSIGTVECHVERDGVLGEGSKGTVEYNIGSVVLRNRGISTLFPPGKIPEPPKYRPLYHNASLPMRRCQPITDRLFLLPFSCIRRLLCLRPLITRHQGIQLLGIGVPGSTTPIQCLLR